MFINKGLCGLIMTKKHIKYAIHRKTGKKPALKVSRNMIISSIILVLIILAVSYYFIFKEKAAATVNGEKIYERRVDAIYNSLPTGSKIPKSQILQQIIDMKLLAFYIERQGYGLSDATFESELKKLLSSQNEPIDEFKRNIALWGVTMDDYKESMEISIFVKGVLENKVEAAASIVEKERKTAEIKIFKNY